MGSLQFITIQIRKAKVKLILVEVTLSTTRIIRMTSSHTWDSMETRPTSAPTNNGKCGKCSSNNDLGIKAVIIICKTKISWQEWSVE